ncbi:MAG: hypothetical protein ABGY96_04825 [bacterium]|nr:folate-binding protein [Gammaproteobacteria bacterium]HIL94675.1 folate-binding protein [Pseudomonadales bacterium]
MDELLSLSRFGFLSVTGKDATKFLQGYTTCDLEVLDPGEVRLGAICNIQGRMVSNFYVVAIDDGYLLRMSRSLVSPTQGFLKKYIVFSKAVTRDLSDSYHCYGRMESMAGFPPIPGTFSVIDDDKVICVDGTRYEIWTGKSRSAADDISPWIAADIMQGHAWVDEHSANSFIPQMFNQHELGGISFDKGCYLGQEIVARMQYRGELKKRLHRGHARQTTAIKNGDNLLNNANRSVGTIVTSQGQEFLAVIQTKSTDDGQYFLADQTALTVVDLANAKQGLQVSSLI